MEAGLSSGIEPRAKIAGADAQSVASSRRLVNLKRSSGRLQGVARGAYNLPLFIPRYPLSIPFDPSLFKRVTNPPACFYHEELDYILDDPRLSIENEPAHFEVASSTPFGGNDELDGLREEWKTFLENNVSTWKWYSRVEAAFIAFVFVSIQTAAQNDLGTYSVSYLALGASCAALATSQLLVRHFDDTVTKSLHYALHFKYRRRKIHRLWWRPSLEKLLSFPFWNHIWCTVLTTIAFCYSFIQATSGSIIVTENAVLVSWVARVLMASIGMRTVFNLTVIHLELHGSWHDLRSCPVTIVKRLKNKRVPKSKSKGTPAGSPNS